MESFISRLLSLSPDWAVSEVSINDTIKRILITIEFQNHTTTDTLEIGDAKSVRYLPIFEFQTFISAPMIWTLNNGVRAKRLAYPWESNIPKEINNSNIL